MDVFYQRLCVLFVLLILESVTRTDTSLSDRESTVNVQRNDAYRSPPINSIGVYFAEHFDDEEFFQQRWVQSVGNDTYESKWEIQTPLRNKLKNDRGLVLVSEGKHAAISTVLDKPFEFKNKWLIVQYEVTFQEDQKCGGAYIMLLSQGAKTKAELPNLNNQSRYTILFGPVKCGNDSDLHFNFRYMDPKDSTIEKKYTKKVSKGLEHIYSDKEPHLYTLIIQPDNSYTILIDNKLFVYESFPEEFALGMKDDPNSSKSDKWAEREKCTESATSTTYMDCFKKIRFIPMLPIYSVGFALWAMTPMILFDNVLITDDPAIAQQWVAQTFALKRPDISKSPREAITDTEEDEKEGMELKIQNKSNKGHYDNPELELITANNEYLLIRRLKYAGVVLGSFVFMGFITYICCGPKSNLKNTDANTESIKTKTHKETGGRWKKDPQETESEMDREVKEEVDHGTGYKLNIVDKEDSEQTDRDVREEVGHDIQFKSNIIDKENSKKHEPERIITDDKLLKEEQKHWGVNPWLYAGVIVGSCIYIGVATYMWSGQKSESDEKTKKNDAAMKNDSIQSKSEVREHSSNKMEKSTWTQAGKATLETPDPERIANHDESEGDKRIEVTDDDDFRSNSSSEDVTWRGESSNNVIKRPTRTRI